MVDEWMDVKNKSLIKLLPYYPSRLSLKKLMMLLILKTCHNSLILIYYDILVGQNFFL